MKRNLLFILILIVSVKQLSAQHETDNWYFGYNAGISFSSGSPVVLANGAITSDEGCSSISDNAGNLLFYSNGVEVWNRNHQLMPNGSGLYGQTSVTQSCLIVKRPGWANRYYIFTMDIFYTLLPDQGLNYSEIDMSLNGGFGDIIFGSKNINLIPDSMSEKLCGVKNSNGNDIWVLVHPLFTNSFYSYLVTSSGISAPVVTNIGPVIGVSGHAGQMKFSLSGTKLALANGNSFELYDFNTSTGVVSNPLVLSDPDYPLAYGVEFSPDESKLYVSNFDIVNDSIYQYDLSAGTDSLIIASKLSLGSVNAPSYVGQLQLASDGKIYIVKSLMKLTVINSPNNLGFSCNMTVNGISLLAPGQNSSGLPNFIASYFLPTGIAENNSITNFSIYPNPFTDVIKVADLKIGEQVNIVIYDLMGEKVFEKELSLNKTEAELNLSFLQQGVYFLNVKSNGGSWTRKIVKM